MAIQNPNFTVNQADLDFILKQIIVAEREVAGETLQQIIGPNAAILPMGLRHVDGSNNNLLPGGTLVGAADQILPRLVPAQFLNDPDGDTMPLGPGAPIITNNNYGVPGNVADADPRTISNLIVDMTTSNPAAIAAWFANPLAVAAWEEAHPGLIPVAPPAPGGVLGVNELALTNLDLSVIPNQSPDIGLSPQFNGWMTFFGQFFDHGLDLITKGGNGTIYIPLQPDDPLYVVGSPTNFMALTRSTPAINPVTGLPTETVNTTTPWVDQNQTYTSHPSHQVFLREYMLDAAGHAVSTGSLLDGAHGGIATWADTKAQAQTMLGLILDDYDVNDVPLLATDAYGEFIRGPNGFAQLVMPADAAHGNAPWLLEGQAGGLAIPANALRTGHAFLNDIAHHAAPVLLDPDHDGIKDIRQTADLNPGIGDDGDPLTYDDEMLNSHFVTGDGRGNENIGLTAVHNIFHSEHNRLVEANKATLLATAAAGDVTTLNQWLINDVTTLPADLSTLVWDGERLFQAAKFVTEMQYQHMVFEEFARKVQPAVNPFVFTNTPDIDPSIVAEFAHVVYRFGHSMLTDTIDRLDINMTPNDISLFDAFLNPQAFEASGLTAAQATGAIIRGMTRQAGNEIDEFVVNDLRNRLVGLPLDLPALNIARGREAGVPAFNVVRDAFYQDTGNVDLKPYESWIAYAQNLKNPLSIVNFIAAYGTHPLVEAETTLEGKRGAAMALVLGTSETVFGAPGTADDRVINGAAALDRVDFLNHTGTWAAQESGLNLVDLWIGGLAERKTEFGGMLGSTFNYVFENQMEKLQNGDRLYYLSRLQGTNLLNELEPNTFAAIVMRNTDLGDTASSHVSGTLFDTPDLTLEINQAVQIDLDPVQASAVLQAIDPKVTRHAPGADVDGDGQADGGYLRFSGGEHVVLGGTEGNDTLIGDRGIDALWGDGGDDYLNGQTESDQVFGGDGDDIIVDPFGDNLLRGDAGNDVISAGAGLNILFGGEGNDFINAGTDGNEVFAGRGNDFVRGGIGNDALLGNEGDDWLEGGDGFDGLSGENSDLFFNSPIIGHDILNGQNNDTDYDGETGDDIMFEGPGIQRNNGMLGFDWGIHKFDPNGANSDLALGIVAAGIVGTAGFPTQQDLTLRDRFDSTEGLSGWSHDDTLQGSNAPVGAVGANGAEVIGGTIFDSALLQSGVARIHGLRAVLGGTDLADPNAVVLDSHLGANILLGGGGSDLITGKAGNDIIDGDAWLNVRIAIHANKNGTGALIGTSDGMMLQAFATDAAGNFLTNPDGSPIMLAGGKTLSAAMLDRSLNPGQLEMVREILYDTSATAIDVAVFSDVRASYDLVYNAANLTVTIIHARGTQADGTDTVRNIELLRFADVDVPVVFNSPATGSAIISDLTPTEGQLLTLNTASIADANGLGALTFQWQSSPNGVTWTNVVGATAATFTPDDNAGIIFGDQAGLQLRVNVSFIDGAGFAETITSAATGPTGVNWLGNGAANTLIGTAGDDIASGAGGNDTLNGNAGADLLNGGGENDSLSGGLGNDTLNGDAGNDRLIGGDGNDSLTGGTGTDVAVFAGAAGNYSLETSGANIIVTDNVGTEGVDTVATTDVLSFNGVTFAVVNGTAGSDINLNGANGAAGSQAILGFGGNDVINGGGGNDLIHGGAQNDTIIQVGATGGRDFVNGGANEDTYQLNGAAGAETFTIYTRAAALTAGLSGFNANTEIVITRNGNTNAFIIAELDNIEEIAVNTLQVSSGGVNGGADGGDTIIVTGDFTQTSLNFNTITIDGNAGDDTIDITSLSSAHRIVFRSNGGHDTIVGTLRPQDVIELPVGAVAGDYDVTTSTNGVTTMVNGSHSMSFTSTGGLPEFVITDPDDDDDDDDNDCGEDDDTGLPQPGQTTNGSLRTGTSGADVLIGTASANDIIGLGGDDVLIGEGGDDAISGGEGDDFINAGEGRDVVFAGAGDDQVFGGAQADMLYGDGGNDRIFGDGGNDLITAGAGNDTVVAGAGDDMIVGAAGDGDDVYFGDNSDGGTGKDTLDLSAITANLNVDLGSGLLGRGSAMSAQSGSDTLWNIENVVTGSGQDMITASNAANVIEGGAGNDLFRFLSIEATEGDTIIGFEPGDRIDLSGIDANSAAGGNQTFTLVSGPAFTAAAQIMVSYETRDGVDYTVVKGSVDAAPDEDFRIELRGTMNLAPGQFVL